MSPHSLLTTPMAAHTRRAAGLALLLVSAPALARDGSWEGLVYPLAGISLLMHAVLFFAVAVTLPWQVARSLNERCVSVLPVEVLIVLGQWLALGLAGLYGLQIAAHAGRNPEVMLALSGAVLWLTGILVTASIPARDDPHDFSCLIYHFLTLFIMVLAMVVTLIVQAGKIDWHDPAPQLELPAAVGGAWLLLRLLWHIPRFLRQHAAAPSSADRP